MSDKNAQPSAQRASAKLTPGQQETQLAKPSTKERPSLDEELTQVKELIPARKQGEKYLLYHEVLQQIAKEDGYLILQEALQHGCIDIAKVLVTLEARVSNKRGNIPFRIATKKGYTEIVELLLSKGGTKSINKLTQTPLQVAVLEKHFEVVKLLLTHSRVGRRADERDVKTALSYLMKDEDNLSDETLENLKLMLESVRSKGGLLSKLLESAVFKGQEEVVKVLLESGCDADAYTSDNRTLLISAVYRGNAAVTSLLLKHGAKVDRTCRDEKDRIKRSRPFQQRDLFPHSSSGGLLEGYCSCYFQGEPNCCNMQTKYCCHFRGRSQSCCNMTALHYAAVKGLDNIASDLLDHGACIDSVDNMYQKTALHFALREGRKQNKQVVKTLLERGAKLSLRDGSGKTPFQYAFVSRYDEVVEVLVDHGADIHSHLPDGNTVLQKAIVCGYKHSLIEVLLARGASVNVTDQNGNTPLHLAAKSGPTYQISEVMSSLLLHGADVNCKNHNGKTALYFALFSGAHGAASLLLDHNAEVDVVDTSSNTPLYDAAGSGLVGVVSLLLKNGAQVDRRCQNMRTAFHAACAKNHTNVVSTLLEQGAVVNLQDEYGKSPLILAIEGTVSASKPEQGISCGQNKSTVFDLLLENGADIRLKDERGDTALHRAVAMQLLNVAVALLSHGCDVNIQNIEGKTPLHMASALNYEKLVLALMEHHADIHIIDDRGNTPLHVAVAQSNENIVLAFLIRGADANSKNCEGKTAFHVAAESGQRENVSNLLKYGAELHAKDDFGCTALHYAATTRLDEGAILHFLLRRGADIDCKNKLGETPLLIAANGNEEAVSILLDYEADVDSENKSGETALHVATAKGNIVIVSSLLEYGAYVDFKNKFGKTALYIAIEEGHVGVTSTLLKYGADVNMSLHQNCHTPLELALEKTAAACRCVTSSDHERNACSKFSEIAGILWKQIVLLSYLHIPVHKMNVPLIDFKRPDVENFKRKCEHELELIKIDNLKIGGLSLYDVLTASRDKLCSLVKSRMISYVLKSQDYYETNFPIFGATIPFRLRAAEKRIRLKNEASFWTASIFPNLPDLCIDALIDCDMSDIDLSNLVKASKTNNR